MKRVLLVEDLPQVAQHLQAMLAREKEVEIAGAQSEPEAAIAQIATEKPDIVMIDALLQGKVPALDIARCGLRVLRGGPEWRPSVLRGTKQARPLRGLMMAVYSPKGGIGKTTLAVN